MVEDEVFFVAQKAFIRKGDEVLVLNDPVEGLDYPGGKIQVGESSTEESLKREVREEVGLEIKVGMPFLVWTETFQNGKNIGKKALIVAYSCEYVSGDVSLSEEHDKFRWVNKENYSEVDDGTSYFGILEKYFDL